MPKLKSNLKFSGHPRLLKTAVKKMRLSKTSAKDELNYWLSRSPDERIWAVEILRSSNMQVLRDFKELLELLNEQKVKYVIVGGYAVAFHGAPRYTGDIDILVKADKQNAARILKALKDFGFTSLKLTQADFEKPDVIIQFGIAPVRVDIITSISGVTWQKAFQGRKKGKYGDVPVSYLGRKQLIENKKATGRLKDLADIEALKK